jgi:hypothetical protein
MDATRTAPLSLVRAYHAKMRQGLASAALSYACFMASGSVMGTSGPEAAVALDGHRVGIAARHGYPVGVPAHADRGVLGHGGAVPQLTVIIVSPGLEAAVGLDACGVEGAAQTPLADTKSCTAAVSSAAMSPSYCLGIAARH